MTTETSTETSTEPAPLFTAWANQPATTASFDADQIEVEKWAKSPIDIAHAHLVDMTLADIEELIDTADDTADEHEKRAWRARALTQTLRDRLAEHWLDRREKKMDVKEDTSKHTVTTVAEFDEIVEQAGAQTAALNANEEPTVRHRRSSWFGK